MRATKRIIVAEIAEDIGFSKDNTAAILTKVFRALVARLIADDELDIKEFGTFTIRRTRHPRPCRNFHTGERIMSKATWFVKFTPVRSFTERLDVLTKEVERQRRKYGDAQ